MVTSKIVIMGLLFILASAQNLSKDRMLEIFRNTAANETDIVELVSNVNSNDTVEGKQEAAAEWVRDKLADSENVPRYETLITSFIGNLSFAHNYVLDIAQTLEHGGKPEENKFFAKLRRQYVLDQEKYGNDVWCALLRFLLAAALSDLGVNRGADVLNQAIQPYPPKRRDFYRWSYLKDVRNAFKTLAWRKLYENLTRPPGEPGLEYLFYAWRGIQKDKFGFRDYVTYADMQQ